MAFVKDNLIRLHSNYMGEGAWRYVSSTDDIATLKGNGYITTDCNLNVNDIIFFKGTDGERMAVVSAISPTIDTLDYNGVLTSVSDNSIDSEHYVDGSIDNVHIADDTLEVEKLAVYATNDSDAGTCIIYHFSTPGGATANTDVTLNDAISICALYVHTQASGTAGDTVQIQTASGAANVSQVYNLAPAQAGDNISLRITPPNGVFSAGAGMRIAQVDGGGNDSPELRVTLIGFKNA